MDLKPLTSSDILQELNPILVEQNILAKLKDKTKQEEDAAAMAAMMRDVEIKNETFVQEESGDETIIKNDDNIFGVKKKRTKIKAISLLKSIFGNSKNKNCKSNCSKSNSSFLQIAERKNPSRFCEQAKVGANGENFEDEEKILYKYAKPQIAKPEVRTAKINLKPTRSNNRLKAFIEKLCTNIKTKDTFWEVVAAHGVVSRRAAEYRDVIDALDEIAQEEIASCEETDEHSDEANSAAFFQNNANTEDDNAVRQNHSNDQLKITACLTSESIS